MLARGLMESDNILGLILLGTWISWWLILILYQKLNDECLLNNIMNKLANHSANMQLLGVLLFLISCPACGICLRFRKTCYCLKNQDEEFFKTEIKKSIIYIKRSYTQSENALYNEISFSEDCYDYPEI